MAKFYGKIGYVKTVETERGIWEEQIIERTYGGDITSRRIRYENHEKINDDVVFNKTISVIVDPYAIENYGYIKYVEYFGAKWKVTSIDVELPRIILTTGGVYYENSTGSSV